jgi:OmpA-OmpF porin, OOP family
MMRPAARSLRDIGLLAAVLTLLAAGSPARAQTVVTRDDIVAQLNRFETPAELDIPAMRQQVLERSRSRAKNEPTPQKRPPIAPELNKLPTFNVSIQFDVDTPIVQPASYETLGRIADALVQSNLLPYTFLIVGHIESTGRRENNVILSQRRADAIRDILVNSFKIGPKRLQTIGLGEEQLLDSVRINAPVNNQVQIMTVAKIPEQAEQPAAAAKKPPAGSKKPPKKR